MTGSDLRRAALRAPILAIPILAVPMLFGAVGAAHAHASEQGLVLLLPTDFYIASGAAAVALTVVLMAVLPARVTEAIFAPLKLLRLPRSRAPLVTSTLSALLLLALIRSGWSGPRDPAENPMTLAIWTVWWIGVVAAQGLLFDLWRWINPWGGPLALLRLLGLRPWLRLPARLGYAPAIVTFLGFAAFLMADPAPADPARLASVTGGYWLASLIAAAAFGPRWLRRSEGISVLMRSYARLGLLA
ncbi:MAG: hypothetical protein AB7S99_21680, partial [Pseudodonghicola sp.]